MLKDIAKSVWENAYAPYSKFKVGVAIKYGSKAIFSFLYRPGAINFHICESIIGLPTNIAAKKASFK